VACAETPRGTLVGESEAWEHGREPERAPAAQAPSAVWTNYAQVLHWPPANSAPFRSRGHLPEQEVDVRVNDVARSSYDARVTDTVFPEGAVLAELSHANTGHGYVMRKISGNWSYLELDAPGVVLASGALPLCAGCHAQAPADSVFGLPSGS
jgi:hypothetical protein